MQTLNRYDVVLSTAADSDPFDGSVFLTLIGDGGVESNEVALNVLPDGTGYLRGGDATQVKGLRLTEVGTVNSVRVRTAKNAGAAANASVPSWRLATLSLTREYWSPNLYSFDRALPVAGSGVGIMLENAEYDFVFTTSDIRGSGTDGCVHVVLTGEKGSSQELMVSKFTRGAGVRLSVLRSAQMSA